MGYFRLFTHMDLGKIKIRCCLCICDYLKNYREFREASKKFKNYGYRSITSEHILYCTVPFRKHHHSCNILKIYCGGSDCVCLFVQYINIVS
jgi:hypothetical protein